MAGSRAQQRASLEPAAFSTTEYVMKRSTKMLCTMAFALGSSVLVMPEDAHAGRRGGLAGSQLILDEDDVFLYPQYTSNYANMLSLEVGATAQQGNALLIAGSNEFALGVVLHRNDGISTFPYASGAPLGDRASTIDAGQFNGNNSIAPPTTVADLLFGMSLGEAGDLGARVTFGAGSAYTDPAGADATQNGSNLFALVAGYSLTGPLRLDASLNFQIESGASVTGGDNFIAGSRLNLGANVRGFAELTPNELDLGFLTSIQFQSFNEQNLAADPDINSTAYQFLFQAGAGPVWNIDLPRYGESARPIGNGTTIAAYGVFSILNGGGDPNLDPDVDQDTFGATTVVIPGVHAAADIEIFDWLHFRAGAQYNWSTLNGFQEVPGEDEFNLVGSGGQGGGVGDPGVANGTGFGWSTGIGLSHDTFRLDAVLASNFLTNGPFMLSGAGGPMFQYVAASYMW
jgi:hypothetical protein